MKKEETGMEVREAIRTQPMRPLQVVTVLICLGLGMMDGFEILVMGFVTPHLARAWDLGQVQTGYLLSASVFGAALGAAIIAPLADRIGRRRHVIACLLFITLGMAFSPFATSVAEMVTLRVITGLFIGALVVSLNVLVSEYCSDKRRGPVMGLYGIGLPGGAALGGAVSAVLIARYSWQAPFVLGAVLAAVMLVLVCLALPESIEYLIEKRPPSALKQYNQIAARLGYANAAALPDPSAKQARHVAVSVVFRGIMGRRTVLLWIANALLAAAFYVSNTWTAKLIADATGNPQLGVKAGVLVPLGGVIGALVFAGLSTLMRPRLATVVIMLGGALAFFLFASSLSNLPLAMTMALALLVGVSVNGGAAAYYAITPSIYPAAVRATGMGWMVGVARGFAILAPLGTGYLLAAGVKPAEAYQIFSAVMLVSGVSCWLLDRTYRGRSEDPERPNEPIAVGSVS